MTEVDIDDLLAAKITRLDDGRLILSLYGDDSAVHLDLNDTDAAVLHDVSNELLEQKHDATETDQ